MSEVVTTDKTVTVNSIVTCPWCGHKAVYAIPYNQKENVAAGTEACVECKKDMFIQVSVATMAKAAKA